MATDSKFVIYTGTNLPYINVVGTDNDNLQTILGKINTAINSSSSAPNYSGYNLYCITQTNGVSHPTNTQNFAEGISKIVCDNKDEYDTFVGTQYPSDQSIFTTAITDLQEPGLTYAAFSIVNTDTISQVYAKQFTGFTNIINSIKPNSANWANIGASVATSTVAAFNTLIAYELSQDTEIDGKEPLIGTFDNDSNCLSGTSTDTAGETIDLLIAYVCDLPTFDYTNITFGGVSSATDLEGTIQNTITSVNYLLTNGIIGIGAGITRTTIGSTYQGYKVAMDTAYLQYYKSALSTDLYTDADFLDNKIVGDGTTIEVNTSDNPGQLTIVNLQPNNNKVAINVSDTDANYLSSKILGAGNSNWGLSNIPIIATDNSTLSISPGLDPDVLIPAIINYISTNPEIFTLFQSLVNQTDGGSCTAPSNLSVVISSSDFDLTWTASGTATSQNVKYRERNTSTWLLTPNVDAPNPQTNSETTATVENLNLNTVYQFAIDSVCSGGGVGTSNIYEMIIYDCANESHAVVGSTVSIQQAPLSTIDTVEYQLWNSTGPTLTATIIATGINPIAKFTNVSSGTYTIKWRYGTLINGVTLYSNDASQLNALCTTGSIVVP